MNRWMRPLRLVVLLLAALVLGTNPAQAARSWTIMSAPDPDRGDNVLTDVTALSSSDAWAVGGFTPAVQHWTGSAWTLVPVPNPGQYIYLSGVSALSADDVWAGGVYVTSDGKYHSLAVHWNGIVWTYVPSLDVGSTNTVFNSVVAIAPGDVWAVGYSQDGSAPIRTLVEHWNGSSWRIVPSPSPGTGNSQLFRIAAVRPPGFRTLMASGAYTDANGRVQPLVERWTGSSWVVQPVPDPGTAAELSGIELLTSGEAWAVGAYLDASSNARPLAERWNGRSWAVVSAPDPGSGYLRAVAARSIADVWAVGYSVTAGVMRTLAEHWNGASWSIISTPNATPNNNVLYGVTVSPTRIPYALSGRVLAVGFANHVGPPGAPTQQLIECYC